MHVPQSSSQTCEQSQRIEKPEIRIRRRKTFEDYEFVVDDRRKVKTSDLGVGAYGTVKRVKDKATGELFAMKIVTTISLVKN